ncbi:MAG: protoheme IX farnesyltransferase [Phycisphaeraceae bacterium]|nr:protoheme IX farnesyltransferase [Phycisphaeraceae bacterium]
MSQTTAHAQHAPADAADARPGLAADLLALSKPGITKLVTITVGLGFAIGAVSRHWEVGDLIGTLLACLVGAALSSSGANALNQCWERERDALMPRTMDRPIPRGRVTPMTGVVFAFACLIVGAAILGLLVNAAAMTIALATTATYILFYTPMKVMTPIATLVGAVPGALPPMIGWAATAATPGGWDTLASPVGWSLFGLLFAWQVPHFHAISWMYRDDYAAGGFKPLPVVDPTGVRTARSSILWLSATIAVSCVTPILLLPGWVGVVAALPLLVVGVGWLLTAFRFAKRRERDTARRMFFGSIIYLPLAMLLLAIDAALVALLFH